MPSRCVFYLKRRRTRIAPRKSLERASRQRGLGVLGWRVLETDNSDLGEAPLASEPRVEQLFLTTKKQGWDSRKFDQELFDQLENFIQSINSSAVASTMLENFRRSWVVAFSISCAFRITASMASGTWSFFPILNFPTQVAPSNHVQGPIDAGTGSWVTFPAICCETIFHAFSLGPLAVLVQIRSRPWSQEPNRCARCAIMERSTRCEATRTGCARGKDG